MVFVLPLAIWVSVNDLNFQVPIKLFLTESNAVNFLVGATGVGSDFEQLARAITAAIKMTENTDFKDFIVFFVKFFTVYLIIRKKILKVAILDEFLYIYKKASGV
jgi:hypothetical protein